MVLLSNVDSGNVEADRRFRRERRLHTIPTWRLVLHDRLCDLPGRPNYFDKVGSTCIRGTEDLCECGSATAYYDKIGKMLARKTPCRLYRQLMEIKPIGRPMQAPEIAPVIAYHASNKASSVSGKSSTLLAAQ